MVTRRAFLGSTVAVAFAGCMGPGGGSDTETPTTGQGTTGSPPETPELDLREANVTAVRFSRDGREYEFAVELYHDDDGEDGYADWWQVERLDGERLGRRDLTHPHSNQPFERPGTIELPEDISCVVVRGHDQTHGYGGQAMLVSLSDGATRAVTQGSDPQSFSESECA